MSALATLAIGETTVRQHNGLFSLNDLHQAAGGEEHQRPNQFIRLDTTQALIEAIKATDSTPCLETRRGANGGTYACRELVVAYAAWINAPFHLKVLRVFLASTAPAPADTGHRVRQQSRQMPLLPAPRRIRCRDDLSFTKRDDKGRLINWFMPERPGNWHEHYGIGEIWFNEIVELARHSPQEAYHAMLFAGPELIRYWNYGHPEGFFDRMARWALAAILANPTEPQLPFNLPRMGTPPREGMDFHLAAACNQRQEK